MAVMLVQLHYPSGLLADFNKHFLDSSYQSQQDVNISVESVTSAALVAARALHEIALDGKGAPELKVILVPSHCLSQQCGHSNWL